MSPAARCFAAVLLTATALGALAQERVYRCGADGRSYSQESCPAGHSIAVDDARSAQQVAQARLVARRDMQLAERLARERESRERAAMQLTAAGIGSAGAPRERHKPSSSKRGRDKPAQVTLYRGAESQARR